MITPDLTAFVARMHLEMEDGIVASDLESSVRNFMSDISLDCVKAGAKLIGHIKCVAETPGDGHLACSVTDHDGRVRSKGSLTDSMCMDIVINVILYGLEIEKVEKIVKNQAESKFMFDHTIMEIESIEIEEDRHNHHHDHDHDHDHHQH